MKKSADFLWKTQIIHSKLDFIHCFNAFFINMRQRERPDVKHAKSEKKKCVTEGEDIGRERD